MRDSNEILRATFYYETENQKRSSLPLDIYLTFSHEHIQEGDYTLGAGESYKFSSPMWDLCRYVKGHPEMKELSSWDAKNRMEEWMQSMGLTWGTLFPERYTDDDDAELEFLTAWDKICYPIGWLPLVEAESKARQKPLTFLKRYNRTFSLFLSIAARLQSLVGDGNIMLPCHSLDKIMGCSHETVARCHQLAVKEGFLILKAKGEWRGRAGAGHAAEFRFVLDRFDNDGKQLR